MNLLVELQLSTIYLLFSPIILIPLGKKMKKPIWLEKRFVLMGRWYDLMILLEGDVAFFMGQLSNAQIDIIEVSCQKEKKRNRRFCFLLVYIMNNIDCQRKQ